MASEQQIKDWNTRKSLFRGAPQTIEIHGPRRDYDYATFCVHCCNDAMAFAHEWMDELIDDLDVDESAGVEVRILRGEPEECLGDVCIHMRKEDDNGN